MVLISNRLETEPDSSGVGVFPEGFSVSTVDRKVRRAGVNQGLDGTDVW